MRDLRPILLVEDSPKDAELTMAALSRCQLLNDVIHVRDGAEALDYCAAKASSPAPCTAARSWCCWT